MGGGIVLPPTGGINFHFRSPSLQLKYLEMPWWPRQRNVPRNCGLPFARNIPGWRPLFLDDSQQPGMIESQWLDGHLHYVFINLNQRITWTCFRFWRFFRVFIWFHTRFFWQWGLRWFEYQQSCMNMWPQHIGIRYGIQVIRCGKTQ